MTEAGRHDRVAGAPSGGIPGRGRVFGVDLGAKRVGVAVSDGEQRLATSVTTLVRRGDRPREHRELAQLVSDYEVVGIVFGLPRSLSGALGPAASGVLEELEAVAKVLPVPVETVDERLSTVQAASALRAAGRDSRRQRDVIDQVAAAVLLQSWLDRRAGGRTLGASTEGSGQPQRLGTAEME
ncbi:MAG: Holliday junction resolvase RuvX [Thermoplasmata archaeon]